MKELEAILALYEKCRASGIRMNLATVVNKFGSAYRRPGARMLFTASGDSAGSISGGCIERDLLERASEICTEDHPRLLTYRAENGDPYDFGSGCEGIIYTLLEPVTFEEIPENNYASLLPQNARTADISSFMEILEMVYKERRTAFSATVFSAPDQRQHLVGSRVVQFQDSIEASSGSIDDTNLLSSVLLTSEKLRLKNTAFTELIETSDGTFGVFFEKIEPPIKLLIFGAGDDVIPVSAIANVTGLSHSITDYRSGLLTAERFPLAESLLKLRPEQYLTRLTTDQFTACVVMHHHYDSDKAAVQFLLENSKVPYIGILGPKKRTARMLAEMQSSSHPFAASPNVIDIESRLNRLFAPIGLDIGAETPEEIALSIIAEVTSFFRSKSAFLLRDKDGPIHDAFDNETHERQHADEFEEASGLTLSTQDVHQSSASVEYVQLQCKI